MVKSKMMTDPVISPPLTERLADALAKANRPICEAGRNFAGLLLAAMTLIVMVQVVARYGFNNSPAWTEELAKTMMVWTAFLVAPWAYREGTNVSISFFTEDLPKAIKSTLQIGITLLVIWICAVFFAESLDFVLRGMQSKSATLPMQVGAFYVIVPVSFALLILVGIETVLRELAAFVKKDGHHPAKEE
ncbi:TRAP transporter small permease [Parvularcula sp. IMCC14364]|uniref:TRAP transporter small permease n=1 Tax=Parvularcula sp. IMCC14364 TaxID=3067902 RepID=UPI002741186E|nr:TRAP transporter small permease [Parvularcula sp. IMCC14364]